MKSNLLVIILILSSANIFGQNKYLIILKDKNNSPFSTETPLVYLSERAVQRRLKQEIPITSHDFPPNPSYVQQIAETGVKIINKSRWMNAVLIDTDINGLKKVLSLPIVKGQESPFSNGLEKGGSDNSGKSVRKGTKNVSDGENILFDPGSSSNQLEMLGVDKMHARGFTGKGMLIGILDSGFQNADKLDVFNSVFVENRVLETFNFVNPNTSVYQAHNHGTSVFSCIASNLDGQLIGTAPDATFALYVTENVTSETRLEEVNWLLGAERADSVGVDVINSSLGYSTFDKSEMNYTYADLDGNKSICTRAADWAASKGILVVLSAGNEGNKGWKYITTPADADSVISVAAVDANGEYVSFSSVGPSADGQIKPELAAKGLSTTLAVPQNIVTTGSGTSFASPLLAGMVAGFRQAFPDLNAMEIRSILLKSGSQAQTPDEKLGYGIPDFERAYDLAQLESVLKNNHKILIVYPNPAENTGIIKVIINNEDSGSYNASISDSKGRVLWTNTFSNKLFEIPLNEFGHELGLYVLKVWNDNLSLTERILLH